MTLEDIYGTRPTVDEYFITMAMLVSMRGTCRRRRVGCVLVNSKNHVLGTGYNGVARGQIHCLDSPCPGAMASSGEDLDKCYAIHAEQNALLQCQSVENIYTCYTTIAMCVTCTKLLLNTGTKRIVFLEPYGLSPVSKKLWMDQGGKWIQLNNSIIQEMINGFKRTFISSREQMAPAFPFPPPYRSKDLRIGHRDQGSPVDDDGSRNLERRRLCSWSFTRDRR